MVAMAAVASCIRARCVSTNRQVHVGGNLCARGHELLRARACAACSCSWARVGLHELVPVLMLVLRLVLLGRGWVA
eukprot:9566808-Alexandrium_andersonii.AAC.1